ncbi:MAG TPA: PIN domain-containing protein [Vicinamibacteria bacterium]|nr:PIN domain-containing protein [Vicinamibacteria bacterium]
MVSDLWKRGDGVLSTQVLQEFFVIVTRKLPKPMDVSIAQKVISNLLSWEIVVNDGKAIVGAIEVLKRYRCSFWDALIVHAALQSGAAVVFSEDLSSGQRIRDLRIENPFR